MKNLFSVTAALLCILMLVGCGAAQGLAPTLQEILLPEEAVPLAATQEPLPTQSPALDRLTAAEAKAIALQHAGLTEDQLRFLRVEFDYDDGIPRYELEFVSNGWEYEYDIHAETGEILSFDKDR